MNGCQVLHQQRLLTEAQSQRDRTLLQKSRKPTHYKHVLDSGNYAMLNDRPDQGQKAMALPSA
jgi:hypothetical protein